MSTNVMMELNRRELLELLNLRTSEELTKKIESAYMIIRQNKTGIVFYDGNTSEESK